MRGGEEAALESAVVTGDVAVDRFGDLGLRLLLFFKIKAAAALPGGEDGSLHVPLHLPARGELQSQAALYTVPERKEEKKSERLGLGFAVCTL